MMNEIVLVESCSLRQQLCKEENISILDRVGQLELMPGTASATTQQVANFFMSPKATIDSAVKRHKSELLEDGYKVIPKKELSYLHDASNLGRTPKIAIFPKRAILRLAMVLRTSEVAKEVRTLLLDKLEELSSPDRSMLAQMASQLARHAVQSSNHSRMLSQHAAQIAENSEVLVSQSQMIVAVVNELDRNRVDVHELKLEIELCKRKMAELESQLTLESKAEEFITPGQIDVLKVKVKEKGEPHRIWRRLNRYFGVSRYCHLSRDKFDEVLQWLEDYED